VIYLELDTRLSDEGGRGMTSTKIFDGFDFDAIAARREGPLALA